MARRVNWRKRAEESMGSWESANPIQVGETRRAYARRMRDGVAADMQRDDDGSGWFAIFLQVLPLVIDLWLKRKKT